MGGKELVFFVDLEKQNLTPLLQKSLLVLVNYVQLFSSPIRMNFLGIKNFKLTRKKSSEVEEYISDLQEYQNCIEKFFMKLILNENSQKIENLLIITDRQIDTLPELIYLSKLHNLLFSKKLVSSLSILAMRKSEKMNLWKNLCAYKDIQTGVFFSLNNGEPVIAFCLKISQFLNNFSYREKHEPMPFLLANDASIIKAGYICPICGSIYKDIKVKCESCNTRIKPTKN